MLISKPQVSEAVPISDAYVPVLKLKFHKVDIDLLFSKLPVENLPKEIDSLEDDSMLINMSRECILSLNGKRMTDSLLKNMSNPRVFSATLRLVKLWAKSRGI
mmetsp:Transcript_81308/g.175712  ORF Transcript_81308/g.175712 Transcript_81308/m.175712 type:complete len:103 (+) Transcript_81308:324-632(+)